MIYFKRERDCDAEIANLNTNTHEQNHHLHNIMGLTAKLSKRTTVGGSLASGSGGGGEGWGMGFFLVFFPQEHHHHHHHQQHEFNSSSPFKSSTFNSLLRRTNSTHILSKAQSTISICALLIFFSLLLFTLSTFEPNTTFFKSPNHHRRHLSQSHLTKKPNSHALQRLGTLYSRGTKPMNDLVLCHVTEHVTLTELKSFLRAFHRSGLLSKSDLLFIFPTMTTPEFSDDVIREENQLFLTLIHRYKTELGNGSKVSNFPASFDVTQVMKSGKATATERGEPIWGRRINKSSVNSNSSNGGGSELTQTLTRVNYGSVVGFGVGEVDPEYSLSGFLEHVPMSLRRWAAYPMILGRLRRNYKHVMLVDVKEVLLFGDPLGRVRNRSPESVFLSSTAKHNRKTSDKTINPAVIIGGARGVRRLSAAMLTEIVRATTQHKKKTPVTESVLLSRLATNEFAQKSIHIVTSTESIPEASSLSEVSIANKTVVRRGNSNIDIDFTKHICSFRIEASVYSDCGKVQPF